MLAVYCWHEAYSGVVNTPSEKRDSFRENYVFLCKSVLIEYNFVAKVGRPCPLNFSVWGPLNLCRLCACCYNICEFRCASMLLCLENVDSLALSSPLCFLPYFCLIFIMHPFPDHIYSSHYTLPPVSSWYILLPLHRELLSSPVIPYEVYSFGGNEDCSTHSKSLKVNIHLLGKIYICHLFLGYLTQDKFLYLHLSANFIILFP